VFVAIIKKQLNPEVSLYTLLQILSVSLFEKIPLKQTLANSRYNYDNLDICNQLDLFSF